MQILPSYRDWGSPGTNLALSQLQGFVLKLAVPPWGATLSGKVGKVAFCHRRGDRAVCSMSCWSCRGLG